MLFLLSPSKKLDYDTAAPFETIAATPLFTPQAAELIAVLRKKKPAQVAALMDLSDALAALNVARYAAWRPEPTPENSKPALFAFAGDVYAGLQAASLDAADVAWAQDHLVLLSGLYGALRPLDALQPYRLEMGSALRTRRGKDLYAYWGDHLAAHLNQRLAGEAAPVVVNLASVEYARAALRPALKARVVDCAFEDWKDGRYKIISFFAKRARGLLARHAVRCRAARPEDLLAFDADGYAHDAAASEPDRLVFRRRQGA
ncbi:MAG: peroxide stress protein YaaA [Burkholderiales bacterium]|nr:peroxide stress protein YaaA [Burkholderiales bacterium]MDE2452814.1 peroxide stress protein YaaA [Burkholderiales bacterium]